MSASNHVKTIERVVLDYWLNEYKKKEEEKQRDKNRKRDRHINIMLEDGPRESCIE